MKKAEQTVRSQAEKPETQEVVAESKHRIQSTNEQLKTELKEAMSSERAQKAKTAATGVLQKAKAAVDQALDDAAKWGEQQQTATVKGGRSSTVRENRKTEIPPGTPVTIEEE